jgi:hypothetical protein
MNKPAAPLWPAPPDTIAPVPPSYWGVWSRTLLQTPQQRDTSTFVRWMQLGRWHVDLRVPASDSAPLQGFCGVTEVSQRPEGEVCTWRRLVDYEPPRATVDEGFMVFETPERVIETGIHSSYHEVWERLPGSLGQRIALAEPEQAEGNGGARIFVASHYLMRVRPCAPMGPQFEISFGAWDGSHWTVEQSTLAALVGQRLPMALAATQPHSAEVRQGDATSEWAVLEWFTP